VFRSLKSAIALVAVVATLGLTGGPAAASALTVHVDGGATGCCRTIN
jgi:hypothetical protein